MQKIQISAKISIFLSSQNQNKLKTLNHTICNICV